MVEILEFEPSHQPWFEDLNRRWIEKYFEMEPLDYRILQNPEREIITKGGFIFMASCQQKIVGTVALKYLKDHSYELTKMAVDENFQGKKIGRALAEAAIARAKSSGALTVVLYSSTRLKPALALYRSLGFQEVPVDGPYKRSDIKMELMLT
jgi:ribosomal protein S18 acetylase RimI-like enzyme